MKHQKRARPKRWLKPGDLMFVAFPLSIEFRRPGRTPDETMFTELRLLPDTQVVALGGCVQLWGVRYARVLTGYGIGYVERNHLDYVFSAP